MAAVAQLVSRLSLEQKVAQLVGLAATDLIDRRPGEQPTEVVIDTGRLAALRPHGTGHLSLAWFLGRDGHDLQANLAAIQSAVRETSPFGIGVLVHNEAISGFLHSSGSQFPTSWAQAATWNPELTRRAAAVSAAHMGQAGVHLAFSPVMDINRDCRWGRVHETYGEDPELAAQFSVAFTRGIQASGGAATGKHFLGYGASEGGLNQAVTQLGRRALTDEYAVPFRRAIAEAGLLAVMNSYNEVDGIPASASRWLLTELLREQLGFTGLVVSDYDAVNLLRSAYHTATSEGEAARQALSAGLDVELPGDDNYSHLVDEVKSGRLDEAVLDLAVTRVLELKARLGLVPGHGTAPTTTPPDLHEAAGVRADIAAQSLVLLHNDGVLPLAEGRRRIVVVGPAADELRIHFGAYTSASQAEMPLGMQAIMTGQVPGIDPATFVFTDIFQPRMPGMDTTFEATTRGLHPDSVTLLQALRNIDADITYAPLGRFDADPAQPLAPADVAAAVETADVVIAAVGERTGWVGNNTAGEGQSTAEPTLPGDQEQLLTLLAATGKQVVTVVVSGRPLLLGPAVEASNAVLLAPLVGEVAGETIAAALFGRINPSGKLPSTFPRHLGQLPIYHGHHYGSGYGHPTGTRHGYGDLNDQHPLFAFGHGLSYTTFAIEFDKTTGPAVVIDGPLIRARLIVANTGCRDGDAVVQLYARDEAATVVRPVRQLLEFARVSVAAGERAQVTLQAPIDRLHYTLADGRRGIEAGEVTVMAALSSDDAHCAATVTVAGDYA